MAKFVIAGKSNCPHYVKAELLGDACAKNLPNFQVYKKVVDSNEWNVIIILSVDFWGRF